MQIRILKCTPDQRPKNCLNGFRNGGEIQSNLQEQILKLLIAISKYNGEEVSKVLLEISQDDKNADIIGFKKKSTELYWILRTNAAKCKREKCSSE